MKNYSNTTSHKEKDNFLDAKFKITGSPVGKNLTSNSGVPGLSGELGSHMSGSNWARVPQLLSLPAVEPHAPRQKKHLTTATGESPDTTAKGPSTTRKAQRSQK